MNDKPHKRGFTLVELLLGMSLTLLVGGVLYLMQSTGMSTVRKGTSQLLLTSEIRNKMERMVADLRNAKEILEIQPDAIKMRCYKYSAEKPDPGEDALVTVSYEVQRGGRQQVLWRTENRENPVKMLSLDKIGERIFQPFFEAPDQLSPAGWSYYPFDMVSNDSGQRQRISMLRITLDFKQQGESAALVTSVSLRPAATRIRQPNWKFR
ncbi:MAG: prepilin-type N-terminal cleavage/methylation domain-containing protein [Candidatus Riflebacteria bacterium]|jgi:type II secretory pathway component PulJ|nr:prepilin-type N-terminal cleavage/methylation domain-containing protein [Candidatus Riflebacteria bacterium]